MEVGANCLPEARYKNKYFREAWRFLRFLMNILMVWIPLFPYPCFLYNKSDKGQNPVTIIIQ